MAEYLPAPDRSMLPSWLLPAPDSLWARLKAQGKLRFTTMFNLVWSFWVFGDLIFQPTLPPHWVLVTSLTFPAFLALYGLAYTRPVRHSMWYASLMAVLGYVAMGMNASGGACYVIFACSFMGFHGPVRVCLARVAAVLILFVTLALTLAHWPWTVAAVMTFVALSVSVANLLYRMNGQKDWELKLSHDEVRRLAATAERERIGRDLHDLLGHTLSLITLKLELSRRLLDRDTEAARREMEEAERVARHALAEVRAAVTGIRTTGLAAELASARLLLGSSAVTFNYITEMPVLPARLESELALVLREAVTNIHRHAEASIAEAKVQVVGNELTLCIADNGSGTTGTEGNGLCGMRERVRALGGTMSFESTKGKGTRVMICIPLTAGERRELPGEPRRLAS
ncbi:MAG TPA: sensor histidine kinase [Luteibacter sp.]|uniref:sensor histidine kinase n=1 Tax=Luteibacter sp. TaxID=1886636 RepID=UPI002F3E8B7A